MEENNEALRPSFARWLVFHVLPALALLILGTAIIFLVAIVLRHKPETTPPQKIVPVVEVIEAQPQETQAVIHSQGTVQPRIQTNLLAEVSGRVTSISPALYAGGFFKKGDVLAQIDDTDYVAALASSKSRYADAKVAYEQELAQVEQAQEDWKTMGQGEEASELVLRKPQFERAKALLDAAAASVASAERDLERTQVKAPYDGRVQQKFIDAGQFVNARTSQIASIYSVDTAEIRLPISLSDTRLVSIPEAFSDGTIAGDKPAVRIIARYGGKEFEWNGIIDRSEGTVDPQTRLLYLVAQVENPYANDASSGRPPLKIGSFVTAEILGDKIDDAYLLPRRALREGDHLYVVSEDRKLEVRKVEPFQKTSEIVILTENLEPGEMVCLTPLQYVVEGMDVLLPSDESPPENEEPDPENSVEATES